MVTKQEDGTLWTIIRKRGGVKQQRDIDERFLSADDLSVLKRLVRA